MPAKSVLSALPYSALESLWGPRRSECRCGRVPDGLVKQSTPAGLDPPPPFRSAPAIGSQHRRGGACHGSAMDPPSVPTASAAAKIRSGRCALNLCATSLRSQSRDSKYATEPLWRIELRIRSILSLIKVSMYSPREYRAEISFSRISPALSGSPVIVDTSKRPNSRSLPQRPSQANND